MMPHLNTLFFFANRYWAKRVSQFFPVIDSTVSGNFTGWAVSKIIPFVRDVLRGIDLMHNTLRRHADLMCIHPVGTLRLWFVW